MQAGPSAGFLGLNRGLNPIQVFLKIVAAQPVVDLAPGQYHRHAVVIAAHTFVGLGGQDGETFGDRAA